MIKEWYDIIIETPIMLERQQSRTQDSLHRTNGNTENLIILIIILIIIIIITKMFKMFYMSKNWEKSLDLATLSEILSVSVIH